MSDFDPRRDPPVRPPAVGISTRAICAAAGLEDLQADVTHAPAAARAVGARSVPALGAV